MPWIHRKACIVAACADDELLLEFERPQRAVTAGQSVVLYDGENCLGGGVIDWADTPPDAAAAAARSPQVISADSMYV